jgi:uncharacterized protein (DUF2384 family)
MPSRAHTRRRRLKPRQRKTVLRQRKTTSRRRKTAARGVLPGAHVYATALKAFGTRERVKRWLQVPLAQFEGRTPEQLLQTEVGARQLEILLARIGQAA